MYAIYSNTAKKHLLLSLSMLLFLLCYNSQSFAQDSKSAVTHYKPAGLNSWIPKYMFPKVTDGPGPDSVVRTDFTVNMSDGTSIDCLKYVPFGTIPQGGYMTVIMVHGFGDNKNTLAGFCHDQATYGYYCMTYSVRGQGNSGGVSNLISNIEANDLVQIVQWVKKDSANGSNPEKILIMGGSQGGILPMKMACLGGQPVATIISALAPPNYASSWIENGCIKMTCLWTMDYPSDTARYSQQVINMKAWIYDNNIRYWDSLVTELPIGRDYTTQLTNIQIPVLVEGSWQDKFFNASGWLDNITKLHVPFTSYFGAVQGHGGDHSATEDQWHMNYFNNWFFQWLWGMNTGILTSDKYQYAYTTYPVIQPYWTFVHDSSAVPLDSISTPMRLYFYKNGALKTTPVSGTSTNVQLKNQVSSGYTLQQIVDDAFTGTNFNQKFKVDSIEFVSNPLTAPLKWVGAPDIKLDYSSSASTFCQFNFEIYEVNSSGQQRFINRVNYTDRNYTKSSRRTATFRGQAHAHKFEAGSRIKIRVTNLDRVQEDSAFFDGTNPFVLPVMNNGTHNMYLTSNSYIDFPVTTQGNIAHLFVDDDPADPSGNNAPAQFTLSQNYPNPFNPSTMIDYSITKTDRVVLKVYDMLGREVATLINAVQNPGSYNVVFNASSLASGVYFYKISTSNFTDIKKMILVK